MDGLMDPQREASSFMEEMAARGHGLWMELTHPCGGAEPGLRIPRA